MRRLVSAAIAGLVLAAGITQPAMAGPDVGKTIMYNAHVDSPKVYWQGNNFTLNSDAGGQSLPIENTVNWLGRGYSISGSQLYSMDVPENGDLSFMGVEAGDMLYAAPAVNGRNNGPIWAGFGADTDIPIEKFRDSKFDLEIVGFNGPGRMEMLTYYEGYPIRRFLSSHDPHLRQTWVDPGNHTHNQTLFTKPGRYEVVFRATARDHQNRVVASAPQTLVWQVGGPNPESETLTDVVAAYNGAPETGTGQFSPQFTVEPNQDVKADGDDRLTSLTFTTGNPADTGTVVFYTDGFYLGEVPLQAGVAHWNELLGSQDLSLQAVFVPAIGAPSPRWITAPVEISRTIRSGSTSELGQFPEQIVRDPAPAFSTAEYAPTSPVVNFEFNASADHAAVSVLPEDKNLWFKVVGGAYEAGSAYPTCDIEFVSTPAHRTWNSGDWWDCFGDNMEVRLKLITPTTVSLSGAQAVFPLTEKRPQPVKLGQKTESETPGTSPTPDAPEVPGEPESPDAPVPGQPDSPEQSTPPSTNPTEPADPTRPSERPDPSEPTDPNTPSENPSDSNQSNSGSLANDVVKISHGHVDIGPVVVDGKMSVVINDDSREHAKTSVARNPESVTLQLLKNSKVKRSAKAFNDPVFDFMGPRGTELFVSPMQQKNGIVWPGFSSEHIDRAAFPRGVEFEISQKSAPAGSSWWLFTHDSFNGLDMIASAQKAGQIDAPEPLHKHVYWAFNKAGTYVLTVSVSGSDAAGKDFRSSADIRFKVGEEGEGGSSNSPANPHAPALPGDGGEGNDGSRDTGSGAAQPGGSGQAPSRKPDSSKPAGSTEPTRPSSDVATSPNGVLPPQNPAPAGANGFGAGNAGLTGSRGGGAAVAPSPITALSGLPAAEGLQPDTSSDAETTGTNEPPGSTSPLASDSSDVAGQSVFGASPVSSADHARRISVPLIIIVASSIVALAAGGVLLKRRFVD